MAWSMSEAPTATSTPWISRLSWHACRPVRRLPEGDRLATKPMSAAERGPHTGVQRLRNFWRRLSAGLTLQELWFQFRRDARSSMAVYSETRSSDGVSRKGFPLVLALFRAMFDKLSPPRRVLLLMAIVALFVPASARDESGQNMVQFPMAFFSAAAVTLLLALELADRVAMKRDLEIAREIQKMLLPDAPPQIDGLDIAFATRPAHTVAGDDYDPSLRAA